MGRQLDTPVKVSGLAARIRPIPFSTNFSAEVINTPRFGKVKMPIVELYDGTTNPKKDLEVYK